MTWLDPETEKCHVGYEPCSNKTSKKNTICYPPSEVNGADVCPLTELSFSQDQFMFFESNEADKLPLVKFTASKETPCLILDSEQGNCSMADTRFFDIGFRREMLDGLKISQEMDKLNQQSEHNEGGVRINFEDRKSELEVFKYYTRSVASWDYTCNRDE